MIINFFKRLFGSSTTTAQQEGIVKFFNTKKGFGFITIKGSNDEIFVHITNVTGKIREKDTVTFTLEKGKKGPSAVNVKRK